MLIEKAEIFNDGWPRRINIVNSSRVISSQPASAEFKIHGKKVEMSIDKFTDIFLDETRHERQSPFRHGSFKILYSQTVDYCEMLYCVPAKGRNEVKSWDVISIGEIYPGRKPGILVRLKFFWRCQMIRLIRTQNVLIKSVPQDD